MQLGIAWDNILNNMVRHSEKFVVIKLPNLILPSIHVLYEVLAHILDLH